MYTLSLIPINIMQSFHIIRCIFQQLRQVNVVQLFSWFIELKFSFTLQYNKNRKSCDLFLPNRIENRICFM